MIRKADLDVRIPGPSSAAGPPASPHPISLFDRHTEMAYGEQVALEGILASLRPGLSIELGTFRGGSLSRIAAHSGQVHTFDLVSHTSVRLANVTYHLGDSRHTLPRVLHELSTANLTVDFVFVDGDHSREGVERDLGVLLSSDALVHTVVLLHDCANEGVRAGARRAISGAEDLAYADLSFLAPSDPTPLLAETWGGLGVVVVDRDPPTWELERQVLENVRWRTSRPQSLMWHAATPLRAVRREVSYLVRPLARRVRGSRGVKLDDHGAPADESVRQMTTPSSKC